MNSNKAKFKEWCKHNTFIPLFYRHDYYQALFGDNWDVALDIRGEEIVGLMPYVLRTKFGFNKINPELLFPYQGLWINYPPEQKRATKIGYEKEIINNIINQLPKTAFFNQQFHPHFTNWLPFYWKGYQQTTRYTYIIEDISNLDVVFENFQKNIRRHIRKAEKTISIEPSDNIELAFEMKIEAAKRKNTSSPTDKNKLLRLYNYCKKNNCGELLIAKDQQNNVHSMFFYVWDELSAYCLIGVTDEKYKNESSMNLLYWEAIKKASTNTKTFNFNGGIIEPIETFFRAYGGVQTPYSDISKTSSLVLKLLNYKVT